MTKTITRDDVLRYIYKETSNEETVAIEKQLLVNASLMDFYNQTKETIRKINELQIEPSEGVQNKILDYSGSLRFESIS
ncbi:MAG: hypothetical protein MI975_24085 [Cytophagales bacterium]|nr:hypothetical protein [Cytophagales bacterium]